MAILGIDIGGSGVKGAPVDTERGELVDERLPPGDAAALRRRTRSWRRSPRWPRSSKGSTGSA